MSKIFTLAKRHLRSLKAIFLFETLSVFLVFTLVVVVLFFMKGLQSDQVSSLYNVSSFPLIIKDVKEDKFDEIKAVLSDNNAEFYFYKDRDVYSQSTSGYSAYKIREIDKNYFKRPDFNRHFVYFPEFIYSDDLYVMPSNLFKSSSELLTLKAGESGGVVIEEIEMKNKEPYYERTPLSSPLIIFTPLKDTNSVNIGVYASNEKTIINEVKKIDDDIIFSSYRDECSLMYSALTIERVFLMFTMFALVALLFLSFKKTINNMVDERKDEFVILSLYGLKTKDTRRMFFISLFVPMVISSLLGVGFGVFLSRTTLLSRIIARLFSSRSMFVFRSDWRSVVVFLILSLVFLLMMLRDSARRIQKLDISKECSDE